MTSDLAGFVALTWKSFSFSLLMSCSISCFLWISSSSWKEEIEFEKEFWAALEGSNYISSSKTAYWVITKKAFSLKCFPYGEILKKNEAAGDGVLICYGLRNPSLPEFFRTFAMWSSWRISSLSRGYISTGNHSGFFQVSSDTTLQGRRRKDNVLPKHAPQQGYYGSSPGLFQCVHRRSTSAKVRSSFKFTPLPEFWPPWRFTLSQ